MDKDKNGKITPKNLSDKELRDKMDLYAQGGDEKQAFAILRHKKDYEKQVAKNSEDRVKADIYRAQGERAGLSHASREQRDYDREISDQIKRDQIAHDVKAEYRRHETHSKNFNRESKIDTPQTPDQSRDRSDERQKISELMNRFHHHAAPEKDIEKTKDGKDKTAGFNQVKQKDRDRDI